MKRILFIHHSTGANIIKEGKLREKVKERNASIELWDHGYNRYRILPSLRARVSHHTGLTNGEGKMTGKDFNIVLSNNSPKEYAEIFSRKPSDPTLNAILEFDVIAFKNCYPTTKITSYKQLEEFKEYYRSIKNSLKKYPKKQFILITPPPLRKELTELEYAHRAKKLVDWLSSKEFLKDATHVRVFNLFHYLSDRDGYLKKEYTRFLPWDSHPNKYANEIVASLFSDYLS